MLEDSLRLIVNEKKKMDLNPAVIRNYLKEYIQYVILSFLYTQRDYKQLVFKGGSCLRICFDLPRLSEDLDFDYDPSKMPAPLLPNLAQYLEAEIHSKHFSKLETKIQSDLRIYLKFPLLHGLGIANQSQSDKLHVKLEVVNKLEPHSQKLLSPISNYGFNLLLWHYDLPSLMTGKINAILHRIWLKGKQDKVDIKGRDFYDLWWFLQQGIKPNYRMLKAATDIANETQLKSVLLKRIQKTVTPQKLVYDLQNFLPESEFVKDFSKNYLEIIKKYL